MRFSKINFQKYGFIFLCFIAQAVLLSPHSVSGQPAAAHPVIRNVVPKDVFPEMFILLKGDGLYDSNERAYVFFSQGETTIKTYTDGGGIQADGLWGSNVQVPPGLKPGICKVEVEIKNNRSQPFLINVTETPRPPKLSSVSAPIIDPGAFVWVQGNGFSRDQVLEMTDAEGQIFRKTVSGVSTANSLDFTVPREAYSGVAKFRVIENRNGRPEASNEVTVEIRRGAIPLAFYEKNFVTLARGQWFELYPQDGRPLKNAARVELKLTQGQKSKTLFVSNYRRLYFQIPRDFQTGKMQIQTRTWTESDASEWSRPYDFTVAEKPAEPAFHRIETVPLRAEAMFVQDGEMIGITPVFQSVFSRAPLPEKIRDGGKVEIYVRRWEKGGFTNWQRIANYDSFPLDSDYFISGYDQVKAYPFDVFSERFYFETNRSEFFDARRGTRLAVYGNFYAESVRDLKILLENGDRKLYLTPAEHEFLGGLFVTLSENIPPGVWNIRLLDKKTGAKTKLPVKIRLD